MSFPNYTCVKMYRPKDEPSQFLIRSTYEPGRNDDLWLPLHRIACIEMEKDELQKSLSLYVCFISAPNGWLHLRGWQYKKPQHYTVTHSIEASNIDWHYILHSLYSYDGMLSKKHVVFVYLIMAVFKNIARYTRSSVVKLYIWNATRFEPSTYYVSLWMVNKMSLPGHY